MMTQVVLVGLILLFISGCAFLPPPLAYLNHARTGYDVTQIVADEPTLTDEFLSLMTDMDCQFFNIIEGEDVCMERPQE